ncbi:MAG: hypothetical protein JWN72_2830 [Thermoleophilia bacterium]|nr:hypothetical protein [Thermoleophilia bacterium]
MILSAMPQPTTAAIAAAPNTAAPSAHALGGFRMRRLPEAALLDLHGVGFFRLLDAQTGYGRQVGYDSLANARRAAYALSVGADSPAAGVFRDGSRFYVRALAAQPAKGPHDAPDAPVPGTGSVGAQLLNFEGNADAHFAWVRDSRLVLLVDGVTKIFAADAHHQPPSA